MRKFTTLAILVMSFARLSAQAGQSSSSSKSDEEKQYSIPLIGSVAPTFTAESTNGTIVFPDDFGKSWKILLSHPQDFTPVCSSEIMELANHQEEFDEIGAKLIVLSSDALSTHQDWKNALEELNYKGKPIEKIRFPMVDDETRNASKLYGMMHPLSNSTRDVRGVFVLDPDNIVQAIYFYPMGVGRSTDELLRLVKALQATHSGNMLAPANWQQGNDLLVRVPPSVTETRSQIENDGFYQLAWFMWYKKR
jgi:peroxiredoxin (alkyl hydroperoxide reductase subunit C)